MTNVMIFSVIFGFVAFLAWTGETERTKRTRMKIEASLRSEEMARGYAPGTFSNMSDLDDRTTSRIGMTRKEIEKGIKDLEDRLKNLDAILREKNR